MTQEEILRDQELLRKNKEYMENYWRNWQKEYRLGLIKQFKLSYVLKQLWYKLFFNSKFKTTGNIFGRKVQGNLDLDGLKLCVYTCLVGDYDRLKEPVCDEPNVDYIAFTDQDVPPTSKWRKVDITAFPEYKTSGPFTFNRMLKMLPHKYLPDYDYSLYVDASVYIMAYVQPMFEKMGNSSFGLHPHYITDCAYEEAQYLVNNKNIMGRDALRQIQEYERAGFPHHFGSFQNTFLIRKHSDKATQQLMETWWEEYQKFPTRDQISLPFVVWKCHYDKDMICMIEKSASQNYRLMRIEHEKNPVYRSDIKRAKE